MKLGLKTAVCALLATGAVALSASAASAAIVCNFEGACWHVLHPSLYYGRPGVVVHPDSWRWGRGEHYVFREHAGRGYWHNGIWIRF